MDLKKKSMKSLIVFEIKNGTILLEAGTWKWEKYVSISKMTYPNQMKQW